MGLENQRDGKVNAPALLQEQKVQEADGVPKGLSKPVVVNACSSIKEGVNIMS